MNQKLPSVLALLKKLPRILVLEAVAFLISFLIILALSSLISPNYEFPPGEDNLMPEFGYEIFLLFFWVPFYLWVRTIFYRNFFIRRKKDE